MPDTLLRTDILPDSLLKDQRGIVITSQYSNIIQSAVKGVRARSPFPAKSLNEFYGLVKNALDNYETRQNIVEEAKAFYTEEDPDYLKDNHLIITFNLVKRVPGSFSPGPPFQSEVSNWRPILREEIDDTENPGYKRAIFGYWHDNEVKFTVWARTNKLANEKALWFENIMQEYSWYFVSQGVSRVLFLKRESDIQIDNNNAKLYGRPIHYYVRTETLTNISQKTIEQITIGSEVENTSLLNIT